MTTTRRSIEFGPAAYAAPAIREDARAQLQELADSLSGIPANSAFWDSMQVSRLCLVVRTWSFLYSFEGQTIHVNDVRGRAW
jgi:hypothetical protein